MRFHHRYFLAIALGLLMPLGALGQSVTSIINSKHNLSASGPGTIKAVNEKQVCIFCHTPHNAAPVQPLWNRNVPMSAYRVYSSSSLASVPGQPTGSSKLCLSCHDGTIAVGSILSRTVPVQMTTGVTTIPLGSTNLGTDLSGDHPISFTYDSTLVVKKQGELIDPGMLPPRVKLDGSKQLQCTTCHDAHDNSLGSFLVMDNSNSQLCNSCHIPSGEATVVGHNQCADCHQTHNAPSGALLLNQATVTDTCTVCHGSTVPASPSATPAAQLANTISNRAAPRSAAPALATAAPSIAGDMQKLSRHNVDSPSLNAVNTRSNPSLVNCAGCHQPHTVKRGKAVAPNISPALGKVSGVTAAGANTARARYEYEVCFKCHGTTNSSRPYITRKTVQTNIRMEFNASAISFHPIATPGRALSVPSLIPGLTTASLIYCTDCHNSDTSAKAGGGGTNGPHGSNFPPLLISNYDTVDGNSESSIAYALCYRCHERTSILNNDSFSSHRKHIVNDRTPCSVCHDAHGISSAQGTTTANAHLINFDTSVVFPDPITKRLEYRSFGPRNGQCYLLCHGKDHSGLRYP